MIYQEEVTGLTEVCEVSAEALYELVASLGCITIDTRGHPTDAHGLVERSEARNNELRIQ